VEDWWNQREGVTAKVTSLGPREGVSHGLEEVICKGTKEQFVKSVFQKMDSPFSSVRR